MSGTIGGTVATLAKGIMQLSGDTSPPVEAPVKILYRIGTDAWNIQIFDVQITLVRAKRQQIGCLIGPSRIPCKINDNQEKGTWSITIKGIGLWLKLRRQDILNTIGKEGLG